MLWPTALFPLPAKFNTISRNERRIFLDRIALSQRITSILSDMERLTNTLYAMNMADIQRYPENYEVLSMDAALRAETITCRLRHMIYSTTQISKHDYLCSVAEIQNIEIHREDDIWEIKLPALAPKRRKQYRAEFLLDPFTAALERYAQSHSMPQLQHCVICFAHTYKWDTPERRIQDYDNLELKQYMDVAASFILTDDSGLLCDAYNTTELGDEDCLHIFIMDSERFPEWLKMRKNALRSIRDL